MNILPRCYFVRLTNKACIALRTNFRSLSYNTDVKGIDKLQADNQDVILDYGYQEGTTILAMNRQKNKNSLSRTFVDDLSTAIEQLEKDEKSRCLIICSLVKNVFCAGADLKERATYSDEEVPNVVGSLRSLFHRVSLLPMPTVAAIDGAALGGGLELALACDIRFAGHLPKTKLGLVETHWALLPGAGGSQRLPRIIGASRAKELMYPARIMNAKQAEYYGVINRAVDPNFTKNNQNSADGPDQYYPDVPPKWHERPALFVALNFAKEMSKKGPFAQRMLKRAVDSGIDAPTLEKGLEIEGDCYKKLVPTSDRREGMRAFAEKRDPIYTGK